jgi:LPXTG-motif cell wall-anchored protein
MLMWRKTLVLLTIIGTLALFGTASALASGPSAGDQQYVDPLAGQHSSHHSSGNGSGSSSSSSSSSSSGSSSAPATSTPTVTTQNSSATGSSTATAASGTPTATTAAATPMAGDPPSTLPRTGFDAWLAAALGLAMAGGGLYLRRAARAR